MLFVIYINNLPDSVLSDIIMYADDTKMSKEIQLHTDIVIVQGNIFCLQVWSDDWLILFHPDKCVVVQICLPWKHNKNPVYFMRQTDGTLVKLEVSSCEKDIGDYADDLLTIETHIENKVK